MSRKDNRKIILSQQDANLWDEFSAGVKTKKTNRKTDIIIEQKQKPEPKKSTPKATEPIIAKPKPVPQPPVQIGNIGGVDASTFRRLKRGSIRIESRLDLHAMTKPQAWKEVAKWIPNCRSQNKRCLLLVTGKGTGVLQSSVPLFLNHVDIRPHVLCCLEASPKDGGSGAFYIYLKRGS